VSESENETGSTPSTSKPTPSEAVPSVKPSNNNPSKRRVVVFYFADSTNTFANRVGETILSGYFESDDEIESLIELDRFKPAGYQSGTLFGYKIVSADFITYNVLYVK
jgi:hypothetical protein